MLFFVFFNELKFRFFYCLSFFIVSFFFCFFFSKELIFIFVKPLLDINVKKINFSYFIFTEMSEVIYIYFYISIVVSFLITFFILLCHVWFFLIEGLYKFEKNLLIFFIFFNFNIYILYFLILYYFFIPFFWVFFLNFELTSSNFIFGIYYEARINDYIFFMLNIFFIFILFLTLPIFLVCLLYFNILKIKTLIKYRRHFIIIVFIFGGVLTPPDVFSQFLIAIPTLFFYEFIIFFKILFNNYFFYVKS
jgi:sec-independent protein translocase protein TatC